jgi:hypothetical protein
MEPPVLQVQGRPRGPGFVVGHQDDQQSKRSASKVVMVAPHLASDNSRLRGSGNSASRWARWKVATVSWSDRNQAILKPRLTPQNACLGLMTKASVGLVHVAHRNPASHFCSVYHGTYLDRCFPSSLGLKYGTDRLANCEQMSVMVSRRDQRDPNRHTILALEAWHIQDWSV